MALTAAVDATAEDGGTGTTHTWSHTVGTDKYMNLYVIFATAGEWSPDEYEPQDVDINGEALAKVAGGVDQDSGFYPTAYGIWWLADPPTGSQTITANFLGGATNGRQFHSVTVHNADPRVYGEGLQHKTLASGGTELIADAMAAANRPAGSLILSSFTGYQVHGDSLAPLGGYDMTEIDDDTVGQCHQAVATKPGDSATQAGITAWMVSASSPVLTLQQFAVRPKSPSEGQLIIVASRMQRFNDELLRGLLTPHQLRRRYQEVFA